jgi:hypothetical protein
MIDKKIKKLALLGLVIAGIITGSVSAATVAEVPANVVASQNDISIVPKITYEQFPDSMVVKVVNVKRQDVVSVLWNGSDISSQLKKLEKAGHIIVSDDVNGFTVEFDDPNLFANGEFGLSLINKPSATISTVIFGDSSNTETLNKVTVSKSSAALSATKADFIAAGTVKYRDPKCSWLLCWSNVSGTTVKLVGDKAPFGMGSVWKQINTTAKTDKNGYYKTNKLSAYSCSGFTVSTTYKGKTVSQRVDLSTWFGFGGCSGTYTTDLNI